MAHDRHQNGKNCCKWVTVETGLVKLHHQQRDRELRAQQIQQKVVCVYR